VGYDNFEQLLKGAHQMDMHFKNADDSQNIPLVLALLSVWYNNFQNCETEAILPYSQYLGKLSDYLQQAIMESNGKSVDRSGEDIDYQTGTIIWGSTGTNMQHAFMQLVHQGTKVIPSEFIGFKESLYGNTEHHGKLMANYYAQMEALAFGKSKEEVHLDLKTQGQADKISSLLPYKVFKGNRPSTSILLDKLTPFSLGQLIALYEHKIFVQGIIWNIYSYDQFGVELGKELAKKLYKE
jgi:glucose-6-phosphate isomerase